MRKVCPHQYYTYSSVLQSQILLAYVGENNSVQMYKFIWHFNTSNSDTQIGIYTNLLSSNTNKSVIKSIISSSIFHIYHTKKFQVVAFHFQLAVTVTSPVKMTHVADSRSYQLLLININSVSNLMTGQNEIWLVSDVCALGAWALPEIICAGRHFTPYDHSYFQAFL